MGVTRLSDLQRLDLSDNQVADLALLANRVPVRCPRGALTCLATPSRVDRCRVTVRAGLVACFRQLVVEAVITRLSHCVALELAERLSARPSGGRADQAS